jgi:hypothetical protein
MKKSSSEDAQRNTLQDKFKLVKQCPLCSHEYKHEEISVLEEIHGTQLLHITCAACKNAMLTFIMTSQMGTSSLGMLTDLTAPDVVRINQRDFIDEDDVLNFHTSLHGNFSQFINLLK